MNFRTIKKQIALVLSFFLIVSSFIFPVESLANDPIGAGTESTQVNVLPNGSFETVDGSGWASSWGTWTASGTPRFEVDDTVAYDGIHSLKISAETTSRGSINQRINLTEEQRGKSYKVQQWMKTEDFTGSSYFRVQAYNQAGSRISYIESERIGQVNDWTLLEMEIHLPADAVRIIWDTFFENGTGTVWYDDIRFYYEIEEEPDHNLLPNGSFTNLTENAAWKDGIAPANVGTYTFSGSPEYSVTDEVYRSAPYAARIDAFDGSRGYINQQSRAVEVGETYVISAWVKMEGEDASVEIRYDVNGTTDPLMGIATLNGKNDWTYVERAMEMKEGATSITLEAIGQNGTMWIDDMAIVKRVEEEPVDGEMLPNGGFEQLESGGPWENNVKPVGTGTWSVSGSPKFSIDTTVSRSGSHSAKIEATETSRGSVSQRASGLTRGEIYRISGWVKTQEVENALIRYQSGRVGEGNILINVLSLSGTNDWTYFERTITIPDNATDPAYITIESFLENSTGEMWLDDFSVQKYVALEDVSVVPSHIEMNVGDTQQLNFILTPDDATDQEVEWISSDESVATVSEDGLITAVSDGFSMITADSMRGYESQASGTAAVSVGSPDSLTVDDFNGEVVGGILEGQLSASDSEQASLEFALAAEPNHGTVHVRADGTFAYYPEPGFSGTDEFVFMVFAGVGGPKFGTASIDVDSVPPIPELDLLWHSTGKNTVLDGELEKIIYPDSTDLTWVLTQEAQHGDVTIHEDGTFTYTPQTDYTGFDHFSVTVESSTGHADEGQVTVFVLPDEEDFIAQMGGDQSHPRLLANEERFETIRAMVQTDPYMMEWYERLTEQADAVLDTTPLGRSGSSGIMRNRLIQTSLMYQISQDERYAERATEELMSIASFPDWFGRNNNMLTLSEFTFGIALAYDWLHDYLTEEQSQQVVEAIREHVFSHAKQWYAEEFQVNGEINNINLVNNGGFTLAALAIIDKGEEAAADAAEVLRGAYAKLQKTLRFYTEDGAWLEGPAYWHYGGQYLTYMIAGMNNVMGTDYGLTDLPGIANSGEFPVYLLGEGGFFNFYDGSLSLAQPESMWYADFYDRPDFAWHLGDLYRRQVVYDPLYLIFYKDGMFEQEPGPLDRTFSGIETVSMRSAWNDPNALFAAMKGFNDTLKSHIDLDSGSFVFDALGVRWAMDLGNEDYNIPGFWDSNHARWTVYRKTAEGHNTLVVNPQENPVMQQQYDAKALLIDSEFKPQGGYGIMDLTERYPLYAVSMQRGMMLTEHRNELIMQDEVSFMKPSELYWFMHTTADIEVIEDGQAAILRAEDKKLYVKLLEAPEGAVFSEMAAKALPTSPNPGGQNMNLGIQKLAVHMTDVEQGTLSIWMVPLYEEDELPEEAPLVKPLADWSIPDGERIVPEPRPQLDDLQIGGTTIDGFEPSSTFYEVVVPFDLPGVPVIEGISDDYTVNVIAAEQIPGRTLIELTDPDNPENTHRYTVQFVLAPIIGDLPEVNKWPVVDVRASAVPEAENTPENTIDGDLDTRWSASGEQWIQYDLGEAREIGAVSVAYMSGTSRQYNLDILASMDGENWTELWSGQSSGTTNQPQLYPVPETEAQYIRIQGYGSNSNQWNSITEVSIFRPAPIYLRLTAPETIEVGEEAPLTAIFSYGDGRRIEATEMTYEIDNPDVVSVDANGILVGLEPGTAVVTAHDSTYGLQGMAEVTIVEGPTDPEDPVTTASILELVVTYADDGAFANDQAVRALSMHLTAVQVFERQQDAGRIVQHMSGFHVLLDHQQAQEFVSEEAYDALRAAADALISKWQ